MKIEWDAYVCALTLWSKCPNREVGGVTCALMRELEIDSTSDACALVSLYLKLTL